MDIKLNQQELATLIAKRDRLIEERKSMAEAMDESIAATVAEIEAVMGKPSACIKLFVGVLELAYVVCFVAIIWSVGTLVSPDQKSPQMIFGAWAHIVGFCALFLFGPNGLIRGAPVGTRWLEQLRFRAGDPNARNINEKVLVALVGSK